MQVKRIMWLLSASLCAVCILFLTYNANGNWDFVLPFRGKKLLLLLIVAYTIGVSTLLFQTLTNNPILTPSILGFDSLYLLIQSALVFFFGGIGFTQLNNGGKFFFETFLMLGGALLLFKTLSKNNGDLTRMILVGVIFGVLFRSLNNLLKRLIDPTDFAVAQGSSFASFTTADPMLLTIGTVCTLVSAVWIWRRQHQLDVLLLGRDRAVGLGLDYARFSRRLLICSACLVSVSTALVGPILFLGLLVCALVNSLSPGIYHNVRVPMAFLIAALTLVSGQFLFEQVMKMQGVLSVVIEFVGGILFIYLILNKKQ